MKTLFREGSAPTIPASYGATTIGSSPVLFWIRTGTALVTIGDMTYHLSESRALWIPAGTPHTFAADAGSVALPILLPPIDIPERHERVLSVIIPPHWEDWLVYQFARSLGYLRGATRAGGGLLQLLAGASSADDSQRHPAALPPPLPWSNPASEVARMLLRTPGLSYDLPQLAAIGTVSVRTLQRQFLNETGMRFAQWRTTARIAAAAAHLSEGRSVAWTAHQVGFATTSSLSHAFREQVGLTPSEYSRLNSHTSLPSATLQQTLNDLVTRVDQPFQPPQIPTEQSWSRINVFDIVVWVYRGTATVEVADTKRRLRLGDTMMLPAGARITVTIDPGSLLLPLGIRPGGGLLAKKPPKMIHLPVAAENYLLHTLVANYTPLRPNNHNPTGVADAFHEVALVGQRTPSKSGDIGKITQALHTDPTDRRNLADWACTLDRDLASLRTEFVKVTGETFPRWRAHLRMTIARELLDSGMAVSIVARRLGYAHPSGFSKVFSGTFGMSPRRHQQRQQEYWFVGSNTH